MIFTGNNLQLVEISLSYALDELHTKIATCHDIVANADDIDELRAEIKQFEKLRIKVFAAIRKETNA